MKKVIVLFLMVMALAAGAALVACGGGGDDDKDGKATPAAQETKEGNGEEEETPAAEDGDEGNGGGGGSLEDVPIYPGAEKISSGEWSGSEALIPAIGEGENPSDFGIVKYGMYETDDPSDEVFDWYKDKMSGWKEEWTFAGGGEDNAGGIGVWSKDDGKTAAWVVVGEEGGKTSLTIMTGTQ